MISWDKADKGDLKRLEIVKIALSHHPKLIEFVFHPAKPELRIDPDAMLKELGVLSGGERILVRFAMDIWCSSGRCQVGDFIYCLDSQNFAVVVDALLQWRKLVA